MRIIIITSLIITISTLIACDKKETVTQIEHTVDHGSIKGSMTFTFNRDLNPIGKNIANQIIVDELLEANYRINQKLSKSGLPSGSMKFEQK